MLNINKNTIKDVISLALPAVGEMFLYMTIWVLDTVMVGQYGGKIAVSTVGLSSQVLYTFVNVFISMGISIAITSLVARHYGAKKYDSAEEYAALGFFIGLIIALTITLNMFVFSRQILTFGGAENDIVSLGVVYMKIVSIGLFFNMIMNMFNGLLRGYGNTKTPLIASIIINVINLSLDYVLIFGYLGFPELGVKGAAFATAIAQTCGFIFITTYSIKNSKIKLRIKYIKHISIKKLKELLNLSIPSSMHEGAMEMSRLLCVFMIMHIGKTAFASNQITTTIEALSFMPGWGFCVAATTLVGHKIGEKNYEKAREYAYTCMVIGSIFMALCAILFLICPNFLIKLFIKSTEKEVISLGSRCLMVASVEQIPMGISMILGGALKGCGDTKTPFIVSLISSWVIRLPLIYYLIYILNLSVIYVWWITAIQWLFEGIVILILFRKKFKHIIITATNN
ncbi:MATE family efflux transporter [Clostridium aestuarii]|uniref:Probable multidrug resistance protein NorM n=1 Tax=Clostridium aestuarii TaxID=338193 RepID=A0ABT4D2M8_9CLOT|nr:MATE family efflux transporter [Clostridium aestuarii]MCY6484897.1 MATE family efflux transporter [Clostridium aestuarii]